MTPLAWLIALAAAVSLDARIIPAVLPAVAASLAQSPGNAGLGMTAYTLAYGTMQLVWGPLSDRHGRVRVIRLSALLFAAGAALTAASGSLAAFLLARLLTGMFAAAVIPTTFAYIGDTVPYARRQTILARFNTVTQGAQAFAATVAGTVTELVSWRPVFGAFAALTLVVVALMRAGEPARAAAAAPTRYLDILRLATARRLYRAIFLEGFCVWGASTYFGVLAGQRFGWSDLQIGLSLAAYGTGTVAGGLVVARLVERLGERALARAGGGLLAAGFGGLALPAPWPAFVAGVALAGFGLAWLHTTLQTRATELHPSARGRAIAVFAFGFFVGGACGTAAFGRLVDAGLIGVVMLVAGLALLAIGRSVARA